VGRRPDTGAVYRTFFTYDVSSLRQKHILGARLETTIIHSWSCTSTPVSLYRVGKHNSGRLTWPGPGLDEWLDERSGHAHKPSGGTGCDDDPQNDSHLEFGNHVLREVQEAAGAGATELAFGLAARKDGAGESTQNRWKKFKLSQTKLIVDANAVPNTPTSPSSDGRGCATGASRPVLSSARPTIRAVVSDPDGETDLKAEFQWERYDRSVTPAVWRSGGTAQDTKLRSKDTGDHKFTADLVHGTIYRWRARTLDPWSYDGKSGTDSSVNWTGWCEFEVDTQGPQVAPGVSSSVYGDDLDDTYGAVGFSAPFTFTASGVADVVAYTYGWEDPPTTQVAVDKQGADKTVVLTPPPPKPEDPTSGGQLTLHVLSVDRSNRMSPSTTYTFNVGSGTGPTGSWLMADPADATVLANGVSGAPAAELVGGARPGVPGRLLGGPATPGATAVSFDGIDDKAMVDSPELRTDTSFTTSVWTRAASDTKDFRTVLGAPGSRASALFLGRAADNRWRLTMPLSDVDGATHVNTFSTSTIRVGAWTLLTVVYDAGSQKLQLYVNGVLEATAAQPTTFAAKQLSFGRDIWSGNAAFHKPWHGDIADVKIWNRVLTGGEIAPLAGDLVGRWQLDMDGADATRYGRELTLPDTVSWTEDRNQLPVSAYLGDGATTWAQTTGSAVRTDQSYTVAAWVNIAGKDHHSQVVDQLGAVGSAFFLRYQKTYDRWEFMLPNKDGGTTYAAVRSKEPPAVGEWQHLVGVYDAVAGTIRLYVDGALQGTVAAAGWGWPSSGVLEVGRYGSIAADYFDGAIDDVRVYAGALPGDEVERLAAG
jgi:hypothetical protein